MSVYDLIICDVVEITKNVCSLVANIRDLYGHSRKDALYAIELSAEYFDDMAERMRHLKEEL